MRSRIISLVAGILVILGVSAPAVSAPALSAPALSAPALSAPAVSAPALSAPALSAPARSAAAAADPLTFAFQDGCGYVDITVTNNGTDPVRYTLAMTHQNLPDPMGPLDFSLAAGASATHRWLTRFSHGISATSPVLAAPVTHPYAAPPGCNIIWPAPGFLPDCDGNALVSIPPFDYSGLGDLAVAVNGVPGKRFAASAPHEEFLSRLKPGDKVSVLVPAVTDANELTTWYIFTYETYAKCSHMPPVTIAATCSGINVKTVNTVKDSVLHILASSTDKKFTVAQGAALDESLELPSGTTVTIFWEQDWDMGGGPSVAAAFVRYAKPQGCEGAGGHLPTTGARTWMLAAAGGLLLIVGVLIFLLTRRRSSA